MFRQIYIPILFLFIFVVSGISQHKQTGFEIQNLVQRKKIIQVGWEQPSPQILKSNYKMMEANSPFDGICIGLRDTINGMAITESSVFVPKAIQKKWLIKSIQDIKTCQFKKFTDNFLRINTVPGNLKWNDDKSWEIVAKNMGTMAWFAKQASLKGFCYDVESYAAPQFQWNPNHGISLKQAQALARKRGGQLINEIGKEYPNITILGFFMFSITRASLQSQNLNQTLAEDKYGLYPYFLNGILDQLPPLAKMVEGNEDAYYAKNDLNLYTLYHDARVKSLALIANENLLKYKTQYSIGLGLYFDMYTNKIGGRFVFDTLVDRSRLERFRDKLTTAADIAEEYVWVYNESHKWWDIPYSEVKFNEEKQGLETILCEQALPGVTNAIEYAKQPLVFVEKLINSSNKYTNLAINSGFETEGIPAAEILDWKSQNCPSSYLAWRPDQRKSTIEVEKQVGINNSKAMVVFGEAPTSIIQTVIVKPGETYAVTANSKKTNGGLQLTVRWLDKNNNLIDWYLMKNTSFVANATGWLQALTLIKVPDEITKLVLIITTNPNASTDKYYLDEIKVIEINDLLK